MTMRQPYSTSDECSVIAMCCVTVAAVEDPDGFVIFVGQSTKEFDEASLIVDLRSRQPIE